MRQFFGSISRGFTFVWEPRGSWEDDAIREVCRELDLVHCVDPFRSRQAWGEPAYYRLHGIGGYRHRYSDEERGMLGSICEEGDYVLFNNLHMFEDALRFREMEGL